MNDFKRYGIYMVPDGAFFAAGSAWLGWDSETGTRAPHPQVPDLPAPVDVLSATPRKYGFHGTIKPPFRLAEGQTRDGLERTLAGFCARQSPVVIPRLEVRRLGRFVAIAPATPVPDLAQLAADAVRTLDPFRAPPTQTELARRRKSSLNERQEQLLAQWGYPYVMDEFRFHITLTGPTDQAEAAKRALVAHFDKLIPCPLHIDTLALMGEDESGMFHVIRRVSLTAG